MGRVSWTPRPAAPAPSTTARLTTPTHYSHPLQRARRQAGARRAPPRGDGPLVHAVRRGSGVAAVALGARLSARADGTLDVIPATSAEIGGVIEGDGITIAGDGKISQSLTGVVPGVYTKLTVDEQGSATLGELLTAEDIPQLDASKIENIQITN